MAERTGAVQEKLTETRKALVSQMLSDMAEGGLGWQRAWVSAMPTNPSTGKRYQGRNALLLLFAMRVMGTADPRFMTFRQAKEEGLSVCKGAKGFPIERWRAFVSDRNHPEERIPQPKTDEEWEAARADPDIEISWRQVGGWYVFHASQIDGIEPYGRQGMLRGQEAIDLIEGCSPVQVTEIAQDEAYYSPGNDEIVVPLREQFDDLGVMARVLLHEQAHSTMAPSRCDRTPGRFGDDSYAFEELVAEISSMFSACELEVDTIGDAAPDGDYMARHAAYVASWASRAKSEDAVDLIMAAASKAGAATSWLVENCYGSRMRELEQLRIANEPLAEQQQDASSGTLGEERRARLRQEER